MPPMRLGAMIAPPTPDASLIGDDGLVPTSRAGLDYPWGRRTPARGEVIRIDASLSWARLPMPGSLGHINSWLLDDDGGSFVAVDTGIATEGCRDGWTALFDGPLAGRAATRILCTHMHPDHIGLAGWLAERFAAPLLMTRAEWMAARFLLADVRAAPPPEVAAMQAGAGWTEAQIAHAAAQGWGRLSAMVAPLPYAYRRLVDGDVVTAGPHRWRVVVGSGHSPEHACLLNEQAGVLVSGDQVLPRISSNVSLSSGEPDADPLGEWLASIDRLLALPADLLVCPAHGEPFRGLHVRLAALRDDHLERLDELVAALAVPARATDCFVHLFRRPIDDDNRSLATGEALAHLRHLEITGRIRRETRREPRGETLRGVWWWQAV